MAVMGGMEGGREGGVYIEEATVVGWEGGKVEVILKMAGGGGGEGGREGGGKGGLVLVYEEVPGMFELVVGENWEAENEGVFQVRREGGREGGRVGVQDSFVFSRLCMSHLAFPSSLPPSLPSSLPHRQ